MKKLLTAFAMGLLLVGCAREYDDTDLRNRVTTLETKVGNLEANMKAIQTATADGMFVQKVEELVEDGKVVGVTVTYTTGKVVTFQISGAGAETNLSAIRNKEGVLCWALNGEIIQVDGKDLTVGQTPSFSVKDGHLIVTVDGKSTDVGAMGGGLGDAIFKDIKVTGSAVVLTLDDNSTIEIPFAKAFKLVIAKTQYAVTSTDPIEVPYTVENKTENTVVDIFTDANYEAVVEADKFVITPLAVVKGSALAYADSQVGLTSIVKITFGAEAEPDVFEITDAEINYVAEAKDATVEAHAVSNLAFDVKPQADWIHYVETRAQNYTIVFKIDDNPAEEIRTGEVKIVRAGTEEVLQTITIAQKAAEAQPKPEMEAYTPAGWDKVFDMSDYKVNSTFRWQEGLELNPSAITFQWKFWSNKWNNCKFRDQGEENGQKYTLYCNRLSEIAQYDESKSLLLRFSNDGDADGQLCLNAGFLGINQVQVSKDSKPYVWPTGEWVVLTIVCDGSKVYIYDDEELVASYTASPVDAWKLGRFDLSMTWDDGSKWPRSQAFNGYLAYARVWSRALGVEDIAATLCEVPADKAEGLETNWVFDGKEDKYVANTVTKNEAFGLDFTDCWDGNDNRKDNGDAATAAWKTLADAGMEGICYREKGSGPGPDPDPDQPTDWKKVFDLSDYKVNSTFRWQDGLELNPSALTFQWRFYSNKWNNCKFRDQGEENGQKYTLYCNRLGEIAQYDESQSLLLRFSNDGDADGQLCLNAGFLGINQVQVAKDNAAYVWPTGEWVTLTIVSDGTKVSIYDDEELVAAYEVSPTISSWKLGRFDLSMTWDDGSKWPRSQAFNGYLAYARVWSRALGVEDIAATLCSVPAGKDENLEMNWVFDGAEDKYIANKVTKNEAFGLDFTECWDGNDNRKDNGDAAAAAWKVLADLGIPGICQ
jgi:hypothetical protein